MNTLTYLRRGHGFTLVEALIAIGIIGLIAAIVVPVFLSVRESGRRTVCLSNERQIGMAMLQYVEDNNSIFPVIGDNGSSDWISLVYPYLKTTSVFTCPDDLTQGPFQDTHMFTESYGMNSNVMGGMIGLGGKPNSHYKPLFHGALTSPARTVMIFEVTNNANALDGTTNPSNPLLENSSATGNTTSFCGTFACGVGVEDHTTPLYPGGIGSDFYATGNIGGRMLNGGYPENPRHNGGSDFMACDGHVLWLLGKDVSGGRTAPAQDCDQGTASAQPPDCEEQGSKKSWFAAGTLCSKYELTFSST